MNKRQRALLTESLVVLAVTLAAVLAMINLKDLVNRSEAVRAMTQLGQQVLDYRQGRGSLPPESYVNEIKGRLEGNARLDDVKYRALWIGFDASGDEILAYNRKKYRSSFLGAGAVVLRLDGRVEWMKKPQFDELLARQQTPVEREVMGASPAR